VHGAGGSAPPSPWRIASAAYDGLVNALAYLAGASIAVAFVMIILDVTIRAIGISPPSFTTATVEYSLLYLTMFAAPYLVRHKAHVFVDAVTARLPRRMAHVLAKFAYGVCIASSLVMAAVATQLLIEALRSGSFDERGVDIPGWLLYLPIPIGFVLIAVEFARFLVGVDTMYSDRSQPRDSV
jgi:C4-dicarboxylate transporter, DctQ subunit